ncbi:DUF4136 domain-containing protein [Mucilaginibacter agri]|uniref:DUF4136 domain-containing protein n=1 Tax=Mucilaginibacter agri TaxID=2695265 RepID=A0A965ZKX6_9SPHI|nr:DUF4136 domain-containing protein [Mucilaginibacter agri]NCD71551.1 DUF4136 domain-containing protein [Mucilaginibacter agri]
MKRVVNATLILLSVVLISACSSYNYYKAGTTKLNTTQYKSFAWVQDPAQSNPKPSRNGKAYAGNAYYNNQSASQAIKQATIFNLQGKGLKVQEEEPDLLVHYTSSVGRGTRLDFYNAYPFYYGGGFYRPYWGWGGGWGWGLGFGYGWGGYGPWGYGGWGYGPTYAVPENYKEGTIIIDLIDRKTRQIVWRGFGVGELHRKPQKTIDELPKVVEGIFKQLPVSM